MKPIKDELAILSLQQTPPIYHDKRCSLPRSNHDRCASFAVETAAECWLKSPCETRLATVAVSKLIANYSKNRTTTQDRTHDLRFRAVTLTVRPMNAERRG
ncbi:hypothetical protein AVEN_83274-1 [Araneus ventricosus]|uniref:Uncharacterized protein n=1 Tax=Araneus ventricosus TaxID=182803 RepID=A0A4Y2U2J7_ARAVE|nr:hypothetical protein AVEN_83274-1 [Araneus ventricosus]